MSKEFRPLLASPVDWDKVDFGNGVTRLVASRKLDGIRCIVIDGVAMSRSLKPIPNKHVQALFGSPEYEGLDGELICGAPNTPDVYRKTNSAVMTHDGEPDVKFYVFDHVSQPELPYQVRLKNANEQCRSLPNVVMVSQIGVHDKAGVDDLESLFLEEGYEGLMLRTLTDPYKFGRATAKSNTLLKVKRFSDFEAVVVGVEELMHNDNEAVTNELGYTERSSHKENLVPGNTLGALVCKTPDGRKFKIGTGFDADTRRALWSMRHLLEGKFVKYKSFEVGVKDLPRFPTYIGLRDPIDM